MAKSISITPAKPKAQYKIKELFYTLQGEGAHAGRPAVFCRFSKCNLWNGREESRAASICNFCDTDFNGTDGQNGGIYTAKQLVDLICQLWPGELPSQCTDIKPYIVCTGGEPILQLDEYLIDHFHVAGFEVAVETNGTLPLPPGIDWVCFSPKGSSKVVIDRCDELKLVFPQPDALPERFESIRATHYYLQPMADPTVIANDAANDIENANNLNQSNTQKALEYCMSNPRWKLSLQTHKWLNID